MKTITITITIAALLATIPAGQALAGASEDAVAEAVAAYRVNDNRGEWTSPLQPSASAAVVAGPSADHLLQTIVAGYSRDMLDRGGWINPYLDNSSYASGNPLLAVNVGEGSLTNG